MHSGPVQRLVHVDVAKASDHALIQKERLDRQSRVAPEVREELLAGHVVRFAPEFSQTLRRALTPRPDQVKSAEAPHVAKAKFPPVIQPEHDVRVREILGGGI